MKQIILLIKLLILTQLYILYSVSVSDPTAFVGYFIGAVLGLLIIHSISSKFGEYLDSHDKRY